MIEKLEIIKFFCRIIIKIFNDESNFRGILELVVFDRQKQQWCVLTSLSSTIGYPLMPSRLHTGHVILNVTIHNFSYHMQNLVSLVFIVMQRVNISMIIYNHEALHYNLYVLHMIQVLVEC